MSFHSNDSTVITLYFKLAAIVSRYYIAASWEKIYSVLVESRTDGANTKNILSLTPIVLIGIEKYASKCSLSSVFVIECRV